MDTVSFTNMLFQLNHTPKRGFNFRAKTVGIFEKVPRYIDLWDKLALSGTEVDNNIDVVTAMTQ